jgi:hypothetical protein
MILGMPASGQRKKFGKFEGDTSLPQSSVEPIRSRQYGNARNVASNGSQYFGNDRFWPLPAGQRPGKAVIRATASLTKRTVGFHLIVSDELPPLVERINRRIRWSAVVTCLSPQSHLVG